ncbi:MAG: response regulator transcription factor, partial [Anaerolineales bacterium]|nr:response regulator transcription factor [Anaerolineales bacterium]
MSTKILVIDDDIAITELMSALLHAHGFDVVTTNNSAEGIKFAAEKNPNLVLLDLMMPDLDGRQVSREIRKFSNTPILILSAVSDPDMIASVLDAGADGFLSKPVSTNVLVAHIRKMTRLTGSLEAL